MAGPLAEKFSEAVVGRHTRDAERSRQITPYFATEAGFLESTRAAWAADNWFGREVAENWFGSKQNIRTVAAREGQAGLDKPFDPLKADYRGVENHTFELSRSATMRDFELKKLALLDRQHRQQVAGSRNGVLQHFVAQILDPTVFVGASVAKASLGAPALVVGARVAAVEAGLVALTQGQMAARYEDRTAGDAVRMTAYAGVFSFLLGSGIAKALHGRTGNVWGGADSGIAVRREASAARATTMHVLDETPVASPERVARVDAVYKVPLDKVAEQAAGYFPNVQGLAAKIGIALDDVSDDALNALYQAGDKAQRQRITRFRKQWHKWKTADKERQLLELERSLAHTAKDSESWQSNAFAALAAGRKGLTALMLPRVQATAASRFEAGVPGLPAEVNAKIVQAIEGLRQGARKMTKPHGLDDAPSTMPGASVEAIHDMQITTLFRTDEQLRTAAIASLEKLTFPQVTATPIARSILGVPRLLAAKAGELPSVVTGGRLPVFRLPESAEDLLETALQKTHEQAQVIGNKLQLDHITDVPQAVKDLYIWRSGEYQRVGKALREHNMSYVKRELNEQVQLLERRVDELREELDGLPTGSREWDQVFDQWDAANKGIDDLEARITAYDEAIDPKYQPVTLMAPKVRADKEGFIATAKAHFAANPDTRTRAPRHRLRGATRELETVDTPMHQEGRALALWHATVHRVDHAGRPVGRPQFMRKLEETLKEIDRNRAQEWRIYRTKLADSKADPAIPRPDKPPPARSVEEAAVDALEMRLEGMRRAETLARDDGGRYIQSEMFGTARLDPVTFRTFIEDRPTIQFRAYLEREVRRVIAAERMGDPDGLDPMIGVQNRLTEIKAMGYDLPAEVLEELADRSNAYDLLRRQMMAEPLFDRSSAFLDGMNQAASIASNISTSADLGMAGYSVSIDLGQMLAYYGMGPVRLTKFVTAMLKDKTMAKLLRDPQIRHQLGVSGEIIRGQRLRSIQGMDQSFGNQGGFQSTGHYWSDFGNWVGNFYGETASQIMTSSLLSPITDLTQLMAAPLATTRIMQAIGRVATGKGTRIDANILRRIGMEPDAATKAWAQYLKGSKEVRLFGRATDELADEGVVILPEWSTWDPKIAQDVMAMISGDIRIATLHPGIAANRVWSTMGGALHAVSRMYYLFTRWAMVANANVFGKNIEDRTYKQIGSAMMYSTIIQTLVNYAKEPEWVTEDMSVRLKNAFVMSGGMGYLGILNERLERLSGHQLGLRPMMGIDTFAHDPDSPQFRLASLGPVTGKAGAVVTHAQTEQYGKLMRLFMPYQNWWLWSGVVRDATSTLNAEE